LFAPRGASDQELAQIVRQELHRDLAGLAARATPRIVRSNDPADAIAREAAERRADLVVTGVARSELLCATTMAALNRYSKMSYREMPTLLLEFHGSEASVVEQAETVQELARENGGLDFQWATKAEERSKLWDARHHAYFACLQLKAGARALSTDVCVPISRLAECIVATEQDIKKASMPIPLFGHVGDGNFHLMILVDPDSDADIEEAWELNTRLVRRALALGGTCTGEHGIGLGKREFLVEEFGAEAVEVMRQLKATLDPRNLLNPGKVV